MNDEDIDKLYRRLSLIEGRLISIETEFKLLKKLAYATISGVFAAIGIPLVM